MSRHKIHNLAHGIKIQEYNNGSYAYWIEDRSYWKNIPAELGKVLVKELKPKGIVSGAKSGKVTMGEMSVNELIKNATGDSRQVIGEDDK